MSTLSQFFAQVSGGGGGTDVRAPLSGVFGTGKVEFWLSSGTFTIPTAITTVRVRMWGGGGGCGNTTAGGTSSFGAYCSATGGGSTTNPGVGAG